jgi:HD-GYP domain-containing protein (c-di-GMP phosphodiesterase class II)
MVGGYNYTTGFTSEEAFQILIENKELKFDNNIINIFLQRTTYFKLDEIVHLPDDNYIKSPHRPIVQLKNGYKLNLLTSMLA